MKYFNPSYWFKLWILAIPVFESQKSKVYSQTLTYSAGWVNCKDINKLVDTLVNSTKKLTNLIKPLQNPEISNLAESMLNSTIALSNIAYNITSEHIKHHDIIRNNNENFPFSEINNYPLVNSSTSGYKPNSPKM